METTTPAAEVAPLDRALGAATQLVRGLYVSLLPFWVATLVARPSEFTTPWLRDLVLYSGWIVPIVALFGSVVFKGPAWNPMRGVPNIWLEIIRRPLTVVAHVLIVVLWAAALLVLGIIVASWEGLGTKLVAMTTAGVSVPSLAVVGVWHWVAAEDEQVYKAVAGEIRGPQGAVLSLIHKSLAVAPYVYAAGIAVSLKAIANEGMSNQSLAVFLASLVMVNVAAVLRFTVYAIDPAEAESGRQQLLETAGLPVRRAAQTSATDAQGEARGTAPSSSTLDPDLRGALTHILPYLHHGQEADDQPGLLAEMTPDAFTKGVRTLVLRGYLFETLDSRLLVTRRGRLAIQHLLQNRVPYALDPEVDPLSPSCQ